MSKFSKDVISRIKKEHAHPISKWIFVGKRVLVLMFLVLFTVLSSFLLSIILFRFEDLDFDIGSKWQMSLIYAFPYLWLILAVIALIGAYFYFKKTPHGYRHRLVAIGGVLVIIVVAVGTISYLAKFPCFFDEAIQESSLYRYVNYDKYALWNRPEEGFLAGEIIEVVSDSKFLLKDFNGKEWKVGVSKAVIIDKPVQLKVGEKIKILGDVNDGSFEVEEIRSWKPLRN